MEIKDLGKKPDTLRSFNSVLGNAINVKHYGAVGDGVKDDSIAIQSAFDAAEAQKKSIFFPTGKFLILNTIYLSNYVRMFSDAEIRAYAAKDSSAWNTVIICGNNSVFKPKNALNNTIYLDMNSISISGIDTNTYNRDSVLFDGFLFKGSDIRYCNVYRIGTVFKGTFNYVSTIHHSHFVGVGKYFIDGDVIDCKIHNNYINGRPTLNATCFNSKQITVSSISDNFIDFFKYVFNISDCYRVAQITNNTFDYCFRVSNKLLRVLFIGNVFRSINKTIALSSFPNADAEMVDGEWIALKSTSGASFATITNNHIQEVDVFADISGYPNLELQMRNNVYYYSTERVRYKVVKAEIWGEQTNIMIEELMYKEFAELPSPLITGYEITSFNNQIIKCRGNLYTNYDGVWKPLTV